MDPFYQSVTSFSFTLMGLWWGVTQFRHEEWMGDRDLRRMASSVYFTFLVPGVMSLAAHNQEIGQVLLEDHAKNQGHNRDRLLLACAHHTAVHRKYGNPLDCAQRYGAAMGIATLQ